MYRDAHRLLAETTPYVSTTHLVFHLLREIESAVRHVLLPYDYTPAQANSGPDAAAAPTEGTPLETTASTRVDEALPEQGENHKKEIEAIVDRYHLPASLLQTWTIIVLRSKTGAGFAELAHRDALANPRPRDTAFEQTLQQFETLLEQVLEAFERDSFHIFRLLDRLLTKAQPGRRDVTLFMNRVPPNRVTYGYFFSHLENPRWLTLLAEKGVFAPSTMDMEEGRVYYNLWPQADYLKRMAVDTSSQSVVLSLLLVAVRSENPFVQRAIVEIGTLLPVRLAVQLTPLITQWVALPESYASFMTPLFAPFLKHLVQGDEASAALELLDSMLTQLSVRQSYSQHWEYEQLLVQTQPLFVHRHARALLHLLCRQLEHEVYQYFIRYLTADEIDTTARTRSPEAGTGWQRTVAPGGGPSSPPGTTAPLNLLVAIIRQTVEQAVTAQTLTLSEAVTLLDTHPGQIFRRLALYTISQFVQHDVTLLRTWMLNHDVFADPGVRPEYMRLVREGLSMLSTEEQEMLFQWVKDSPKRYHLLWPMETTSGILRDPTEEMIQLRKAHQQWQWLEQLGDTLPQAWRQYYDELTASVSSVKSLVFEEQLAQRIWSLAQRSGPTELSLEAYKAMPLAQFLEELTPSAAEFGGRLASLMSLLSTLIADAPAHYAEQAVLFQGQTAEVVTFALRGFLQATKSQHPFAWSSVLPLCAWVVEQRFLSLHEEEESSQNNLAWAEASKEVAVLLETALHLSRASLPVTWQETIWSMLETLVDDTYGLTHRSSQSEPRPAWSLVLNSTRGEALLAVIHYALWLWEHRQNDVAQDEDEEERWTFEQVPEIRLLLERFFVPGQDDTGVAHAVLGSSYALLFHLDEQWTIQHQYAILPHDEASRPAFDAAWEALLLGNPPFRKVLEALRGEYAFAISRLQSDDDNRQRLHENPDARLASHIAVFVIRGDIATEPIDPLLVHFFQHASDELRYELLKEIGRILAQDREQLPERAVEQCQYVWEWRMTQISALSNPDESAQELKAFGWWVFKDIFPAHWSVEQLARVLRWHKLLDMSSFVVHRLAALVSLEPDLVIQCLSHLVKGNTTSWGSKEWNEAVRTILVEALQQQNETIQAQARAVVSVLMMQGRTQYRELVLPSELDGA